MIIGKLDADGLKMKQVTEWDNNPRMMWVWDMCEQLKEKKESDLFIRQVRVSCRYKRKILL